MRTAMHSAMARMRKTLRTDEKDLAELACADGAVINPEKVGCMVGEMLGLYASGNGGKSENSALFCWSDYKDL